MKQEYDLALTAARGGCRYHHLHLEGGERDVGSGGGGGGGVAEGVGGGAGEGVRGG